MLALIRRHHPLARIAAFAVLFAAIFSGAGIARTLHSLVAHGGGTCGTVVCLRNLDGNPDGNPSRSIGGTLAPCDETRASGACGIDAITRAVRGHAHGTPGHGHDHRDGGDHRDHRHQPHDCAICLELALLVPALSLVAPFVAFSESVALADEPIRTRWTSPTAPDVCAARPPPFRA